MRRLLYAELLVEQLECLRWLLIQLRGGNKGKFWIWLVFSVKMHHKINNTVERKFLGRNFFCISESGSIRKEIF